MIFLIFILGTAIGSFLNVLIDRLPNERSINGRSKCDHCGRQLKWYDLIPIVSYVIYRGRSRCCHKKLSLQYPLIELLTGIIFVLIFNFQFPLPLEALAKWGLPLEALAKWGISKRVSNIDLLNIDNWILLENLKLEFISLLLWWGIASCLIVIFFADLKYQIIPDSMQVVLLTLSIIGNYVNSNTDAIRGMTRNLFDMSINNWIPAFAGMANAGAALKIASMLISGLAVMLPILLIYLITKGRGMGFGDVKLAFNMGVLLGIVGGLAALYIGFVSGAIAGVGLILFGRKKWRSKIAFGPFLVLGIIIAIIATPWIHDAVARLYF